MSVKDKEVAVLVSEKRARLQFRKDTKNGYDKVLVRFWKGIDESKLDECIAALRDRTSVKNPTPSRTVVDPLASNRKREGTWYGGPVEERSNEDGTKDVVQTLFNETATIDFFTVEDNCAYKVERTLYLNSPSRPSLPSKDASAGVTYRMSELFIDKDTGSFTGWVDKRTRQYQDTGLYTSENSAGRLVQRREQQGVTTQDAEEIAQEVGVTKRQTRRKNNDCSQDIETEKITAIQQAGTIKRATIIAEDLSNGTIEKNKHAASVFETPTEEGVTRTQRVTPNVDGTVDEELTDDTAPVLPIYEEQQGAAGGSRVTYGNKNVRTADLAGATAEEQGVIVTYRKNRNTDGTHDESNTLDTSPVLEQSSLEKTVKRTATGTGVDNKRNPEPTATEPTIGQKVTFRKRKNPDNTYTYFEVIEDIAEISKGYSYEIVSCRDLTASQIETGIKSDLSDPANFDVEDYRPETPGTRVVIRLTEDPQDGSYRREVITITAPQLVSTRTTKGGYVTEVTTRYANETKARDTTDISTETGSVEAIENDDCSYTNIVIEETPNKFSYQKVYSTNGGTGTYTWFKNWTLAEVNDLYPTATDKSISVSPSIQKNPFGSYDGTMRVIDGRTNISGGSNRPDDFSYIQVINGITYLVSIKYGRAGDLSPGDGSPTSDSLYDHVAASDPLHPDHKYIKYSVGTRRLGDSGYYESVRINAQ